MVGEKDPQLTLYYTLSLDGRRALHEAYRLNQAMWTVFGKSRSELGRP